MPAMRIENLTINITGPTSASLVAQVSAIEDAQTLDPLNVNLSPEINEAITRLTYLLFGYEAATEPVDEP